MSGEAALVWSDWPSPDALNEFMRPIGEAVEVEPGVGECIYWLDEEIPDE